VSATDRVTNAQLRDAISDTKEVIRAEQKTEHFKTRVIVVISAAVTGGAEGRLRPSASSPSPTSSRRLSLKKFLVRLERTVLRAFLAPELRPIERELAERVARSLAVRVGLSSAVIAVLVELVDRVVA
jgi:hypothetical protein